MGSVNIIVDPEDRYYTTNFGSPSSGLNPGLKLSLITVFEDRPNKYQVTVYKNNKKASIFSVSTNPETLVEYAKLSEKDIANIVEYIAIHYDVIQKCIDYKISSGELYTEIIRRSRRLIDY